MFNEYRDQAVEYIEEDRKEGKGCNWPIHELLALHGIVSQILSENNDQISPDWDTTLAELARIIKQEKANKESIESWRTAERMKEQSRGADTNVLHALSENLEN